MTMKSYKPMGLEWEPSYEDSFQAWSIFGIYRVEKRKGAWDYWLCGLPPMNQNHVHVSSEGLAKLACQQHYNSLWQSGGEEV